MSAQEVFKILDDMDKTLEYQREEIASLKARIRKMEKAKA